MAASSNQKCCLKSCSQDDQMICKADSRAEVCTIIPDKLTAKQRNKQLINWSPKGDAEFHRSCWDDILKSVRARNAKNIVFKFSAAEKEMVKEAAKTAEFHDSDSTVKTEAHRIGEMIKSAKHCVVFTGAGISTSAGIGDYRGKNGKWTEDDRAAVVMTTSVDEDDDDEPAAKKTKPSASVPSEEPPYPEEIPYESLRPTLTHEALQLMVSRGLVQHVISQNCDGLHGLAGTPSTRLSELHGNVFLEVCERCDHGYERSHYVLDDTASQYWEAVSDGETSAVRRPKHSTQCDRCQLTHRTGRRCTQKGCRGFLRDTIINFGDLLDTPTLSTAQRHAWEADVLLCLGSTLRVTPACELVGSGPHDARIVICNRQRTPMDAACGVRGRDKLPLGARVFADCDRLLREVLACVVGRGAVEGWEGGRGDRLAQYDKQRD